MKKFVSFFIILATLILFSGCASLPGKLNPEFAFTVLYFVLANATIVDDEVYLIAEVAILDSAGEVLEFRETLNYRGDRIEWWQIYDPSYLVPGNYVFMITVVDMLGPHTITETLDFKIIAGSFI